MNSQPLLIHQLNQLGIHRIEDFKALLDAQDELNSLTAELQAEAVAACAAKYGKEHAWKMLPYPNQLKGKVALDLIRAFRGGETPTGTDAAGAPTRPTQTPQTAQGATGSLWSRLTDKQRAQGLKMHLRTPEQQEPFAAEVLGLPPPTAITRPLVTTSTPAQPATAHQPRMTAAGAGTTAWDHLTPSQKDYALKLLGHNASEERRQGIAEEFLSTRQLQEA